MYQWTIYSCWWIDSWTRRKAECCIYGMYAKPPLGQLLACSFLVAKHLYVPIHVVTWNKFKEKSTKIKQFGWKINVKIATTKWWPFWVRLKCIKSMSAYIILCLTDTPSAIYNKLLANVLLLYWMHDIYGWHIGVINNIYLIFPGTPVSINTITITGIYGVAFLQPLMAHASCTYELLMLGRVGVWLVVGIWKQ